MVIANGTLTPPPPPPPPQETTKTKMLRKLRYFTCELYIKKRGLNALFN
jgi:hypothetical protein